MSNSDDEPPPWVRSGPNVAPRPDAMPPPPSFAPGSPDVTAGYQAPSPYGAPGLRPMQPHPSAPSDYPPTYPPPTYPPPPDPVAAPRSDPTTRLVLAIAVSALVIAIIALVVALLA